jgi:hypothetical protein
MLLLEVLNAQSGNLVDQNMILKAATTERYDTEARLIVGVDVGEKLSYVVGNQNGLLGYGTMKSYQQEGRLGSSLQTSLEYFLRTSDCVMVINQRKDIVNVELLAKKYPGRVFFLRFVSGQTMPDPIQWGEKDNHRLVFVERNQTIRLILGEFEKRLLKLYRKFNDSWQDFACNWGNIYEVKEEDKSGNEHYVWHRFDSDNLVNATICWRAGVKRSGQRGGISLPQVGLPIEGQLGYMLNPDGSVSFNPDSTFGRDPFDASASIEEGLSNHDVEPWWVEQEEVEYA